MCGRFALTASKDSLTQHFGLTKGLVMSPRYNIAPSQLVPVIKTAGEIEFLQWGFKPKWMDAEKIGAGFINARCDTIAEKPAFRTAFQKRRCLIVASGYYEWKLVGRKKQPFYIYQKDAQVFAFAGIWEENTCAILTTEANSLLHPLHARMPLILPLSAYDLWLTKTTDLQAISSLLVPFPSEPLAFYPVSTKVNYPQFDALECIRSLQ